MMPYIFALDVDSLAQKLNFPPGNAAFEGLDSLRACISPVTSISDDARPSGERRRLHQQDSATELREAGPKRGSLASVADNRQR